MVKIECKTVNKEHTDKFPMYIGFNPTLKSYIRSQSDKSRIFPIISVIHDEYADSGKFPVIQLVLGSPETDKYFHLKKEEDNDKNPSNP